MVEKTPLVSERASFTSESPDGTRELACRLGRLCRGGEALFLYGDLGSGKTCFVQGLARGLELPPEQRVTSPTFTVHAEYQGRLVLNHLDLYRLEESSLLAGFGIEDMLGDRAAVTAVEWPEILVEVTGGFPRLDICFEDVGDGRRAITVVGWGEANAALVGGLC